MYYYFITATVIATKTIRWRAFDITDSPGINI